MSLTPAIAKVVVAGGGFGATTRILTRRAAPTLSRNRCGVTVKPIDSESSSETGSTVTCRRRDETFRTVTQRVACQLFPCQMPKPSDVGEVASSPTAEAPSRRTPEPTAAVGAPPRCA